MCGIVGKVFFDPLKKVEISHLKEMTNTIVHRGPDDEGYFINNNVGMGFRRLSIIDLKLGHQPLTNLDKTLWITFNGEIYNYQELRKDLVNKNYVFNTNSDTEVIVNLYQEYGEDCSKLLRGMFAFVIWDDKKKILFGSRDRLGIKPFFYYLDNNQFVWGSEIKTIKADQELNLEISLKSLDQYMNYGHTCKENSIFSNVNKLPPGTNFVIEPYKSNKIIVKKYWTLRFQPDYSISKSDFEEKFIVEFQESIKMRMISDVPLGAFLSGGVDSSSVVAIMSSMSNKPIKTFSIGFKEQKFNELLYANLVSNKYKTDHHELIIEPKSIDLLPDLVKSYDEPFADSSAIPTYYLSEFARKYVKVALSGDGGDELFAGYSSYYKMIKLHNRPFNYGFLNKLISSVHSVIPDYIELKKWLYYFGVDSNYIGAYLGIFKYHERMKLYNSSFKNQLNNYHSEEEKINIIRGFEGEFISKMQYLDINTYLVDDILTKVDRASMSNSLEVRVPLLDHKIVELCASIPSNFKINKLEQKILFKDAMRSYLPDEVINHPKQGFSVPISMWFREDLKDYLSDKLLASNAYIYDYFNKNIVHEMVNNHNRGLRDYSAKLWSLLFLEEWLTQN